MNEVTPPNTFPENLVGTYANWDRDGEPVTTASMLHEHSDELDVSESELTMSLELSLLEMDRSENELLALFYMILASIVARKRGSVRFNVAGDSGNRSLSERFAHYLPGLSEISNDVKIGLVSDKGWESVAQIVQELISAPDELTILGRGNDTVPLILSDTQLYHQQSFKREIRLTDSIHERIPDHLPETIQYDLDDLKDHMAKIKSMTPFALSNEQQYAILTAVCTPLSIVTGGPGTGKTFVILSLIRYLTTLGVDPGRIAVAAPTGKAANRISETITEQLQPKTYSVDQRISNHLIEPRTLHRLMGYSEQRQNYYYHANRPMPYDYVIVDEASMIDLGLMDQLFSATSEDASLTLLGDANQLPAVESGAVFRELVPNEINTNVPWNRSPDGILDKKNPDQSEPLSKQSIRLTENYRVKQADSKTRNLVAVADRINAGGQRLNFVQESSEDKRTAQIHVKKSIEKLAFDGVEQLEPNKQDENPTEEVESFSPARLESILRHWYDHWYGGDQNQSETLVSALKNRVFQFSQGEPAGCSEELEELFERYNDNQLLTVTRRTTMGSQPINRFLHNYHAGQADWQHRDTSGSFLPGEPVIMNQNDYERNLFNGDQGIILTVKVSEDSSPRPMAVFPGVRQFRAFHLGPLHSQLSHSFALTVHKSQGSEFGSVGIVLPARNVPLLTRELLYTGITRARSSVVFYGNREILIKGSHDRDERNSGLMERLKKRNG